MSKRKWTNIELYEPEIIRLREAGLTQQQIADELFLENVQIKNWLNRYNKRQSITSERTPKPKGRPRKDMKPKVEYAVIYSHQGEYPVSVMCKFFGVSRSGYYDFMNRLGRSTQEVDKSWSASA